MDDPSSCWCLNVGEKPQGHDIPDPSMRQPTTLETALERAQLPRSGFQVTGRKEQEGSPRLVPDVQSQLSCALASATLSR